MHSGVLHGLVPRPRWVCLGSGLESRMGTFRLVVSPFRGARTLGESFLKGQVSSYKASRPVLLLRNLPTLFVARRNVPSPRDPPRSGAEERRVVGITPQCIRIGIFNAIPSSFSPKSGCRAKLKK